MGSYLGPKDWTWLLLIRWRKSQASNVPRDQQPNSSSPTRGERATERQSPIQSNRVSVKAHWFPPTRRSSAGSTALCWTLRSTLVTLELSLCEHGCQKGRDGRAFLTALPPEWGWLRDRPYRARKVTPGIRTLNLDHSTPLPPFHLSILSLRSSPCQSSRKSVALFCLKLTAWL